MGGGEQLKDQWEQRPGGGKAMGGGNPGEWADMGGESSEAGGSMKFGSGGCGQHRQVLLCLHKKVIYHGHVGFIPEMQNALKLENSF